MTRTSPQDLLVPARALKNLRVFLLRHSPPHVEPPEPGDGPSPFAPPGGYIVLPEPTPVAAVFGAEVTHEEAHVLASACAARLVLDDAGLITALAQIRNPDEDLSMSSDWGYAVGVIARRERAG